MKTFKEFLNESPKNFNDVAYQAWKVIAKDIDAKLDASSLELKSKFPEKSAMGLHSDATKADPDFQRINREISIYFRQLQNHNKSAPKEFKRKRSQETRAKVW